MTESTNLEAIQNAGISNNDVPENRQPITNDVKNERYFTQAEVNEIAGTSRKEGAERARREALVGAQNNNYENNYITREEVERIVAQKNEQATQAAQDAARQAVANKVAHEFVTKVSAATEKYPDIIKTIDRLDLTENPMLVDYINAVDNTADVINELAKHDTLYEGILSRLDKNPKGAMQRIQELSKQLKERDAPNRNSSSNKVPLSQINPSNAGINSEDNTLESFKKASWLRG
jgi:hypothetical protein